MGRSVYFPVTIAAVALLVGIAGSGMAGGVNYSEWSVPIVADVGVEGSNADLEFGIHPDAADGYDYGIDLPSPPPGPGALFEAYFSIVHTLFPRLNKDLRGEVPNEWTLKVRSTDEDIELSWNTDDMPQGVALRLVSAEADIDMKVVSSTTLPAGAHTVRVIAEQIEISQHELTISSTSGGEVTSPGDGMFTYDEGTVVTLVAGAHERYRFVRWTGDVNTIANVNAASTTITMNDDYHISANFEQIPPGQFSLTTSSTVGGSVTTPGEATFTYDTGTVVSLVVIPDAGYRFVGWSGDVDTIGDVEAASTTITMQGDYAIRANFAIAQVQHNLTISSTSGGSVTEPGEGIFAYDDGMVVSIAAEAEQGCRFVRWTGDVDTVANVNAASTAITMQGDHTIRANFAIPQVQYNLTISSTSGGSATVPGEGAFAYDGGTVVSLVAGAEEGYHFVGWTGDVDTIANVNADSTTITMQGDYTITANFHRVTSSTNWPLVGGVIGVVVAVGLGIFFFHRGRVA